jgi:hypothetical protein
MSTASVCIANIGRRGRRQRATFGIVLLVVGAGILVALVVSGAPRAWRLALFLPFWAAAIGVLQAREKT